MDRDRTAQYRLPPEDSGAKAFLTVAGLAVVGIFALITIFLGIFKIDETERGVVTRYGKFHHIAQPGLNFRLPWVDGLQRMDVRESNPKFHDMEMYSADQQLAKIDASVVLSPKTDVDSLKNIYTRYGNVDNAIRVVFGPVVPAELKVVFGRYTAQKSIQDRENLNIDSKVRIVSTLGESSLFNVRLVPIEDIEFSKAYVQSIEENMKAEVEVRKIRNNWEKEKVSADIIRTQADAAAYQVKVKGEAEASAIEAQGKALANNPKYVEMLQAQRWDGKLPTTMIPNSTVPFMSMGK